MNLDIYLGDPGGLPSLKLTDQSQAAQLAVDGSWRYALGPVSALAWGGRMRGNRRVWLRSCITE
jgi:hypothetical protein